MLERILSEFITAASYAKHLDFYLMKLDTLLARLHEDYCGGSEECVAETLRRLASDAKFRDALARLACVADVAEYMVRTKGVYSWVRRYWRALRDLIDQVFGESVTCRNPLVIEERPPLTQLEAEEETRTEWPMHMAPSRSETQGANIDVNEVVEKAVRSAVREVIGMLSRDELRGGGDNSGATLAIMVLALLSMMMVLLYVFSALAR